MFDLYKSKLNLNLGVFIYGLWQKTILQISIYVRTHTHKYGAGELTIRIGSSVESNFDKLILQIGIFQVGNKNMVAKLRADA